MRKLLHGITLLTVFAGNLVAQCPLILNCPQGTPIVCDLSGNDSQLWNQGPYTWSSTVQTDDLYEGSADFGIKIVPCSGGITLNISYTLLLDLNNDNLLETVVSSNALPPPGIVFADNAFNPGYTGGEPVLFDKRNVPDSLQFAFALEVKNVGDTVKAYLRWTSAGMYLLPRLPEGKHQLIWRVEQGGVVKYCEYAFLIKDCLPPTPICDTDLLIKIDPDKTANLLLEDVLVSVTDNSTPLNKLQLSLRKAGSGSGFPLGGDGQPVGVLSFDCEEVGSHTVELWAKDRSNNMSSCEATIVVADGDGYCITPSIICARAFWGDNPIVKGVDFDMVWVDTSQTIIAHPFTVSPDGCAELTFLPPASSFSLTAQKDTNPLNGISTFDLLLISRHILGIQSFDSPWKWFAADANRNGSVTSFDVVELRKLLLGIYDKFPANTSWRFFADDCVFPVNPLSGYCPSEYSYATVPLGEYPEQIVFNAVKTGDVNGTANPAPFDAPASESRGQVPAFLSLPDVCLSQGEVRKIDLSMAEAGKWLGLQAGLRYKTDAIEIEQVTAGRLPETDVYTHTQSQQGLLHLTWFDTKPQVFFPGEKLLTMQVKAKKSVCLTDVVALSDERLAPEAYTTDEDIRPLQLKFERAAISNISTMFFPPQPNPTTGGTVIPIRSANQEIALTEVADLAGKGIFQQESLLENGVQMIEIPADAFPQTGVYVWRVKVGARVWTGKIVRL